MQATWIEEIEAIKKFLERWRGATVSPSAYTSGHGVLILGLFNAPKAPGKLAYIQCKDCQVIQFYRTHIENSDLGISVEQHRLGKVHTITEPGRLHIVCYSVFVTEVEKRINFHKEFDLSS